MKRVGFTLLELIFVIVIIGIVGTMVTEIISNVYKDYIISYRVNEMQQKSEYLLDQITGRLKYRIKDSTSTIDFSNPSIIKKISHASDDDDMLSWIGYSNEALRGINSNKPAYSAFIDVGAGETNSSQFLTLGSNLDDVNTIFNKLTNKVDLNDTNKSAGLYMATVQPIAGYWDSNDTDFEKTTFRVNKLNNETFQILGNSDTSPRDLTKKIDIYERYYLAWTAYAIVPMKISANSADRCKIIAENDTIFDLCLFYDFQPWNGDKYIDGSSSLLMQNVTSFRFRAVDQFIRVKVCINDGNTTGKGLDIQKGGNSALGFCKEKGIF